MEKKRKKLSHPHLGKNIRKIREIRDYSQSYVAKKLGISSQRYSVLENKENMDTSYLYKIAEILEINVYKILTFDEQIHFGIDKRKQVSDFGDQMEGQNITSTDTEAVQLLKLLVEKIKMM